MENSNIIDKPIGNGADTADNPLTRAFIRPFRKQEQQLALPALEWLIGKLTDELKMHLHSVPILIRLSPPWRSTETRSVFSAEWLSVGDDIDLVDTVLDSLAHGDPLMPAFVVVTTYADGEVFAGVFDRTRLGSTLSAKMRPEGVAQRLVMTQDERNRFYESFDPKLWGACYPRRYNEPRCGRYGSPKAPARLLAETAMHAMDNPALVELCSTRLMTGGNYTDNVTFYLASHLAQFGTPAYWLSESIATALLQTSPPGEINWPDMPLPYEACVFMMPKGSLTHATGGDVAFIGYARLQAGREYHSALVGGKSYGYQNGTIILYVETVQGLALHFAMTSNLMPVLTLPDLQSVVVGERYPDAPGLNDMTDEDKRVLWLAIHYIFSTLFLMLDRPSIVTPACLEKRVPAKRADPPREYWSPNIIGEDYHVKHERSSSGGSHNSPRFHWVRGCWREQPYGRGLTLRKRIWIEPHTRGGREP